MKTTIAFLLIILFSNTSFSFAQNETKVKLNYGVKNKNLQAILKFENIDFETVTFKGNIQGKSYQIIVKEFKNGKNTQIDTLVNGAKSDYFRIKGDSLSFNLLTQNEQGQVIIEIKGNGFYSKKLTYRTSPRNGPAPFALKDFFNKKISKAPTNKIFPLFAIITPTYYKDGSASYCAVAQSGVKPEKLGQKFDIPHYFIIEMKFI
jgi:hypothetical protein